MSSRGQAYAGAFTHAHTWAAAPSCAYVLLAHDVVEGQLGAPGALGEGGAAAPPAAGAGRLLHDVLGQRQQALLRLLDQVRLDVVAPQKFVALLAVALLHLVVAVQAVQGRLGDVDPPGRGRDFRSRRNARSRQGAARRTGPACRQLRRPRAVPPSMWPEFL